jgi:hypothetical protein
VKGKALDRTIRRTVFVRGYGLVVKQNDADDYDDMEQ